MHINYSVLLHTKFNFLVPSWFDPVGTILVSIGFYEQEKQKNTNPCPSLHISMHEARWQCSYIYSGLAALASCHYNMLVLPLYLK